MRRIVLLTVIASALSPAVVRAQTIVEPIVKLYVEGVDGLSNSIALYRDTALLGSIDPVAHVFQRASGMWWMDRLEVPRDRGFFMQVALHEDVAIVGVMPYVYVFRFDKGEWVLEQTLTDTRGDPDFGHTVATDGELVVVGTRSVDVQVFRNNGRKWVLETRLAPPPRADGKLPFGFADDVEVSQDRVLVAKSATIGDGFEGIYAFRRDGNRWHLEDTITLGDVEGETVFQGDIALDGDVALIDADYDDVVHVFAFDGVSWVRQAILAPPEISGRNCSCLPIPDQDPELCDGDSTPNFGVSVALDGELALVGANLDDVRGTDSGAAYLYRFDGADWRYELMLQGEPSTSCGANFGRLVALHEGRALVRQGRATYFFDLR